MTEYWYLTTPGEGAGVTGRRTPCTLAAMQALRPRRGLALVQWENALTTAWPGPLCTKPKPKPKPHALPLLALSPLTAESESAFSPAPQVVCVHISLESIVLQDRPLHF